MTAVRLSKRVCNLQSSPIREILAVADLPGMISFAGGLPSPETFPEMDIQQMPRKMLQYGSSEGDPALRAWIANDLQNMGLDVKPEHVIVLSGSQQGIDLVGKLFIDSGTRVALQSPSYLAALQVFRFFGMQAITLDPNNPEQSLAADQNRPTLTYVNPTFQNPTGVCWSKEQRQRFAEIADHTGVAVFEDDPYRDLSYDNVDSTPVCASLKRSSWIYQGSFSKNLAPGLRLGFLTASPDLVPLLLRLKQAADLHSSRVSQWLVLEQLQKPDRNELLTSLATRYRIKRDHFQTILLEQFSDLATWEIPAGGLFFWLRLNAAMDTSALLAEALQQKVAFMPGEPFFLDTSHGYSALRLNFSHAATDDVESGLSLLSDLIRRHG